MPKSNSFNLHDNTTKPKKIQVAPLSSQYSTQQNKKNDTKVPIADRYKKKTNNIDERKKEIDPNPCGSGPTSNLITITLYYILCKK